MPLPRFEKRYERALLALAIGALGGALAHWLRLPLAWMIGAMLFSTVAAIGGLPVALPGSLRSLFVAVLGVMLGSGFRPEILDHLGEWSISLAGLLFYTGAAGLVGMLYLRRFGGYDRVTSYFSSMPGGLSEMILVGSSMGGDARVISLMHASRILIVILILPISFQLFLDYDPANRPTAGPPLADETLLDLAMLGGAGAVGFFLARLLRLPASQLVGPMLCSAVIHLAGWTKATPPAEVVAVAQVVIGTAIGCRFAGTRLFFVLRVLISASGLTLILLGMTLLFALALHAMTGLPTPYLILAYAPGGLAEMSLVALALAFDAAFVATHHIVRIFLVVVLAPLAFRARNRGGAAPGGAPPGAPPGS